MTLLARARCSNKPSRPPAHGAFGPQRYGAKGQEEPVRLGGQ